MKDSRTPLELAAIATVAIPGLQVTSVFGPQIMEANRASTRISDPNGNRWTVSSTQEALSDATLTQRRTMLEYLNACSTSETLPFMVPQIEAWALTNSDMPVILHTVTTGEPADPEELETEGLLSASLGRALAALHNLDADTLTSLGVPTRPVREIRNELRARIGSVGRQLPGPLRKRWICAIDEDVLWGFDPAPTHGDLSLEVILVSHSAVRSITEIEHMELADPAVDLAWLLPLVGDHFLRSLVESYSTARTRPDLHLFTRAQLYSEVALLDWLRYGAANGDGEVVSQATQMLAELNQDLDGAMLVEPTRPVVQVHFEAADEPLNRIVRASGVDGLSTEPHDPGFEDEVPEMLASDPSQYDSTALTEVTEVIDPLARPEDQPDLQEDQALSEDPTPDTETGSHEFPRK